MPRGYTKFGAIAVEELTASKLVATDANKKLISVDPWLMPPIIEWYDPTDGLPADPEVGDRYGSDATANGWTVDYIYEWDGEEWVESAPEEGWMIWDLLELIMWVFFSGGWMEEGSDSYWSLWDSQMGIEGDKSGSFNLTTTGNITAGNLNITNWDTAYGWGNHALVGYLTSETDPVFSAWDKSYNDLTDTPTIPTALSELSDDATHRLVTDTEKSIWNAKASPFEMTFDDDDLSSGILTVTHSLGKKYNIVQVYDDSDAQITPDDITLTDTNNCSIDVSSWGTISGTWHVVIIGGVN